MIFRNTLVVMLQKNPLLSQYKLVVSHQQFLRKWEEENLPFAYSMLSKDLFIFLALNGCIDEAPNYKQLFYSFTTYSQSGIRKHLRRMIKDGWIEIKGSKSDKRLRKIVPTQKFRNALGQWIENLQILLLN